MRMELHTYYSAIQKLSNSKAYLFELLKPYGFTEWNDIRNLVSAQSESKFFQKHIAC